MRPFNLDEAKAGKPVCTRDGRDARIICFDYKHECYSIIALVDNKGKCTESLSMYTNSGAIYINRVSSASDLFMKTEKREGWVNIYKHPEHGSFVGSSIFETEESAKLAATNINKYKTTTKIEWEE